MTLIASISGIRGTIGGNLSEGLNPINTQKYALAYGQWIKSKSENPTVVIGRDARISGEMIKNIVVSSLVSIGIDIIDIGLSTTPTVEKYVKYKNAQGGIILTASHNPKHWNALKLLNEKGEFISADNGNKILELAEKTDTIKFVEVDGLGKIVPDDNAINWHIDEILEMKFIKDCPINKNLKIVVDGINSSGAMAVPKLLDKLGIKNYTVVNAQMNGEFAHNPEPLAENLVDTCKVIKEQNADLGIVVDPDVDRLCFISENGEMFGEEYTLVAVADYILSIEKGNTVSNLSSTRALRDVTENHGGTYSASAVGEVNVTTKMKAVDAIIGGEGNGGVIFPESHYGRDALVGIALFLAYLTKKNMKMSELKASLPSYFMSKNKIQLTPEINVDNVLESLNSKYENKEDCNTIDGLKIDFEDSWVHLRKSNTEPIIRIYTEAQSKDSADKLAERFIEEIKQVINS